MCIRDSAGIGPRWVWMSGDDNIMIIAQHLKNAGIEVTWMQHLISNALPALLWLVVSTGLIPVSYTHLDVYKRQVLTAPVFHFLQTGVYCRSPGLPHEQNL